MTETAKRLLLVALTALVLAGCAGPRTVQLPAPRAEAVRHNQRGVEAEKVGNRETALAEFSEALRLHGSIENWDGMVVARINIARTHRLMGDPLSARRVMDRALELLPAESDLAAELYFENAKVYLAAGDLACASNWAVNAARAEKGKDLGRRLNLVGAILLRLGEAERAREQADRALKLNRERGSVAEEANSLRLVGETALARGRYGEAADSFRAALALDKDLGFGRKIADDLRGLAVAAWKNGRAAEAAAYYRRAREVSLSGGDAAGAAETTARLAEIEQVAQGR